MTVTVLIGNSDDKLTQREWALYVAHVQGLVDEWAEEVHFSGVSFGGAPWQNACWVFVVDDGASLDALRMVFGVAASWHRQDSIAIVVGETEFVKAVRR